MQFCAPHSSFVRQVWADAMPSHLSTHDVLVLLKPVADPQHFWPDLQSAASSQLAGPSQALPLSWHVMSVALFAQQISLEMSQVCFPQKIVPGVAPSTSLLAPLSGSEVPEVPAGAPLDVPGAVPDELPLAVPASVSP